MIATRPNTDLKIKHPINLMGKEFAANRYDYYRWLREEAPVYKGKMMMMKIYMLSRHEDCVNMLKDERFVRNRSTATGGGRMPFPLPKHVALMAQSMILEDEPEHRRLRNLVHKAFTPRALRKLETRIEALTHELLDAAEAQGTVDLKEHYASPIPVTVIGEMVGVKDDEVKQFANVIRSLVTDGYSGFALAKMMLWDMRKSSHFVRELIGRKRNNPGDDILTGLIQAEEDGESLSEDELVSMVFLLVVAGYETTYHLITNAVATLLQHPDQLDRLRADYGLLDTAIEEVLRYHGPVQSTKPGYAVEDVTLHGVTIPKGSTVMPLLGAANHDPAAFDNPDIFDIARTPNRHLGFGQGIHYCLGAPLARIETKIALRNLLERNLNLRLAVEPEALEETSIPTLASYQKLPVVFG